MEKFQVHILGCGSALPTMRHHPTSQVVNLREKLFMIDCGEGTQLQLRRQHLKFSRLDHIFISHLHGDHVLGLLPLISTLSLMGRTTPLHIYAHAALEGLMRPQLSFYCAGLSFDVVFHALPTFTAMTAELVFSDRSVDVYAVPLRHRLPACGFIFRERPRLPHIRRDMIDFLQIPHYEINNIKQGAGWTTDDGDYYPHERLTYPAERGRCYAYCSDTEFLPQLPGVLSGVTVLFHEATFGQEHAARAAETHHSTAAQAATVAARAGVERLVIGHYSSRYDDERPLLDEARAVFPHTQLAAEGMVIEV